MRSVIPALVTAVLIGLQAPASSPIPPSSQPRGDTLQVAVLRAQLATMRDHNDQLLATVFWALGTVAGLAVLLVGYNWFTQSRAYERDQVALRQALTDALSERGCDFGVRGAC